MCVYVYMYIREEGRREKKEKKNREREREKTVAELNATEKGISHWEYPLSNMNTGRSYLVCVCVCEYIRVQTH